MRLSTEGRQRMERMGAELAEYGYGIERFTFNPQAGVWELRAGSFTRQINVTAHTLDRLHTTAIREVRQPAQVPA
jgi:hypothetical protein